ncbi:MAG: class I SAM-dependent methyltransferase [Clostridiales Family XIII bacterium]|nr:class I SAM-dependent methyltransferase [Clostridiales Family XIII bacterium]
MISSHFKKWLSFYEEIWLFGAGAYAKAISEILGEYGASVRGYIVSVRDPDHTETGKIIKSIKEFKVNYYKPQKTGIIMAVDCRYYNEIVPSMPFAINDLYFPEERFKMICWDWYAEKHKPNNPYDAAFYEKNLITQTASADELLKVILSFVRPQSVIDIGCGIGLIARKFKEYGVKDVYGVDGEYVDRDRLQLDSEYFIAHDLTTPFKSDKRYDLAVSFEVAEHLDEIYALQFVETLCNLSDIVAFSAAVPGQGGDNHVNEQVQSYWAQLFTKQGYTAVDCIRPFIWNNTKIDIYYRQNLFFYVNDKTCGNIFAEYAQQPIYDVIHPELFWMKHKYAERYNIVRGNYLEGRECL